MPEISLYNSFNLVPCQAYHKILPKDINNTNKRLIYTRIKVELIKLPDKWGFVDLKGVIK